MAATGTMEARSHYLTAHTIGASETSIAVPKGAVAYKVVVDSGSAASCALHGSWASGITPSYGGFDEGLMTVPPGYSSETQACKYGNNVWLSAQAGVEADIQIDWSIY